MPIRKPSEYHSKVRAIQGQTRNDESQPKSFLAKIGCFNIVMFIIVFGFIMNISYESFEEFSEIKVENYEFEKMSCDISNIDFKCQQILHCIKDDDQVSIAQLLEIIWSQVVENYLPPFVGSILLLLGQLSESVKNVAGNKRNL